MFARLGRLVGVILFALTGTLIIGSQVARWEKFAALEEYGPPAAFRIERDSFGVPTIYGETDPATAYGLAIAHAEDDFETIQHRLAAVRGQLGAITGQEGAVADYFKHLIAVDEQLRRSWHLVSPETKAMAQAYADGINAFAFEHPEEVLRHQMFPVRASDIVGGFVLVSPLFFGVDDVVQDLFESREIPHSTGPERRGSNAFAFAPSRMADGSTMLISNSHQPWEGPAAWYEARVASGEGWSIAGALFPGVPFILMGYNENLGWTNTVNVPDLTDIFELELNDAGDQYRYDGGWRPLVEKKVWLKVRFGPLVLPIRQTVYRSVHGPVIKNDNGAFAFRYAGMGEVRHMEQYYLLNKAQSFDEWREVMAMQAIPATNFVYADREGNIAYLYNASFPDRSPAIDWSGVLPGDDPSFLWTDYAPQSMIPFLVNPESGYIVNANNTPFLATSPAHDMVVEDYAELYGIETKISNRILRAIDLLEELDMFDRPSIDRVKYDTAYDQTSSIGKMMVDFITSLNGSSGEPEAEALLRQWDYTLDGRGRADALAGLILHQLYAETRGWTEVLGPEAALSSAVERLRKHFGRLDPPFTDVVRLRRGDEDLPLTGGPDALRALYWLDEDDGRVAAGFGDSYIYYVNWYPDGSMTAETIYPLGAAMGRPNSPHYDDQAPLFADQQLKPMPVPRWEDAAPGRY
ncbi:MAG: penicillin acylase family protein [Pseudomonadota bacterium]